MKKKKHYLSLITIITLMVMIVSILSHNSKKKIEVEVLEGSNKDLGDISLVYAPGNSILNKREVVLSKNGLENNFKSQKQINRDYIDIDKKYNSFIDWEREDSLYENEKYIGKIFFNTSFYGNEDAHIEIKQKNKKTNITEKIKIKLENKIFKDNYVAPIFTQSIDNEIYVATEQDEIGSLQIMKINIKDKTYKILKNINLKSSNNESNVNNIKFLYDNKIYTEIYCYDSKREYTYFMIYDIEKNTITKSNEFMNKIEKQGAFLTQNIFDYQVIDNKLNVLIGDKQGNISKLIYEINDKELKLINSVKLNFKLKYNQDFLNLNQVRARLIDNKIYSLSTPSKYLDGYSNYIFLNGIKSTEFIAFDINDNKVIYKAKLLNADKNRYDNLHFVKNY